MATSGSNNFIQNRNQIILDALQHLGVYGIGRTVSPEDMAFCVSTLNKMVKSWATQGLHLWCKSEGVLYLDQYVGKYSLGNSINDAKATLISDEVVTRLDGALVTSATAVTVDSTTGMTVGDNIGVVLTTKDIHWTTIATIPTSTTLTLTTGVPSASADNNFVYTFTNKIYKPLRILSARLVSGIDSGVTSTKSDMIMNSMAYQDYFEMSTKTNNGTPNQFHYNPGISSGTMYVWPRPSDTSSRIEFTFERIIEDLDNATDDFDFPAEWLEPLTFQLAVRIAPGFGKEKKLSVILPMAAEMMNDLKTWDSEITSVFLEPDLGY